MGEQITSNYKNKHSKRIAIVAGIVGIVMVTGTGIYLFRQSQTQQVETPLVNEKAITSVSALGRIEPQSEVIKVAAAPSLSGAKVTQLLVNQGSVVTQGDIIAITSDYELKKAELESTRKDLEVARTNLAIIQAGAKQGTIEAQKATINRLQAQLQGVIATDKARIARLQAQLSSERKEKQATIARYSAEVDNAQAEYRRYSQLATDGVISQSNLETRQLTLATTEQQYQEAQASYSRTVTTLEQEIQQAQAEATQNRNTLTQQIAEARAKLDEIAEIRTVDVAQAQAQIDRAMALIKQAEIDLELTVIKAPINGTIIDVMARVGENIESEEGVVEMANTSQMLVIAEVYESDISKIKLGQSATIVSENNSFDDRITGEVIEISRKIGKKDVLETDPAASVDARVVEVKIAIDTEDNAIVENLIYSQVIVDILL